MKSLKPTFLLFVTLLIFSIMSCEDNSDLRNENVLIETTKSTGEKLNLMLSSLSDTIKIDKGDGKLVFITDKSSASDFQISIELLGQKVKIYDTKIISLYCADQKIITLEILNCPNLKYLFCQDNQISTLDLSKNLKLIALQCQKNQLQTITLGYLSTTFEYLNISDNKLDACSLNDIYRKLPSDLSRIAPLYVSHISENNSNDVLGSDVSIANSKNWFVCQKSDTASYFLVEKRFTIDGNKCNVK